MEREKLIEKLKENEKPFGLLSENEKVIMKSVGDENVLHYDGLEWNNYGCNWSYKTVYTYRINPNYTEQPETEVVECGLKGAYFSYYSQMYNISEIAMCNDKFNKFIGFKFEDGTITNKSIVYQLKEDGMMYDCIHPDKKISDYIIHRAKSVIFKK